MRNKIIKAVQNIISEYENGNLGRLEAHELLNTLNGTVFDMWLFGLSDENPSAIQDYIHRMQDKYTVEFV
jgi:hypothetical protein